tara:strand:- start:1324 stop:1536 length:213 start_codon:yes stop_codon:yes gene_type:complete
VQRQIGLAKEAFFRQSEDYPSMAITPNFRCFEWALERRHAGGGQFIVDRQNVFCGRIWNVMLRDHCRTSE